MTWDNTERRKSPVGLSEEIRELREALTLLKPSVEEFNRLMKGNGVPGLPVRLDRLEQECERRTWYNRAIVGAVIAVLVEAFWALFIRK